MRPNASWRHQSCSCATTSSFSPSANPCQDQDQHSRVVYSMRSQGPPALRTAKELERAAATQRAEAACRRAKTAACSSMQQQQQTRAFYREHGHVDHLARHGGATSLRARVLSRARASNQPAAARLSNGALLAPPMNKPLRQPKRWLCLRLIPVPVHPRGLLGQAAGHGACGRGVVPA